MTPSKINGPCYYPRFKFKLNGLSPVSRPPWFVSIHPGYSSFHRSSQKNDIFLIEFFTADARPSFTIILCWIARATQSY